MNDRFWPKAVI